MKKMKNKMQRTKFKKWRKETPKEHRTYGEKRKRNEYWRKEVENEKTQ